MTSSADVSIVRIDPVKYNKDVVVDVTSLPGTTSIVFIYSVTALLDNNGHVWYGSEQRKHNKGRLL